MFLLTQQFSKLDTVLEMWVKIVLKLYCQRLEFSLKIESKFLYIFFLLYLLSSFLPSLSLPSVLPSLLPPPFPSLIPSFTRVYLRVWMHSWSTDLSESIQCDPSGPDPENPDPPVPRRPLPQMKGSQLSLCDQLALPWVEGHNKGTGSAA